jgi:hypothetical protein
MGYRPFIDVDRVKSVITDFITDAITVSKVNREFDAPYYPIHATPNAYISVDQVTVHNQIV